MSGMSDVPLPSIRRRLSRALMAWSLAWGVGVSLAVGLAAQHEVDELLDESLQSTAFVLARALAVARLDGSRLDAGQPLPRTPDGEFAWQLVAADARVVGRSSNAPPAAWHRVPKAGFGDAADWRVFGAAHAGTDRADDAPGGMLYVAHTRRERREAQFEVALNAVLAALSIGLLGQLWLRLWLRRELQPLERLSARLAHHDPLAPSASLGAAERAELAPVHAAIDALGARLAQRVRLERAFSAHAAHALRTPLAGMDAQLAVALREATSETRPRLARVRDASTRLQSVVRALLDLFRVGRDPVREPVDLQRLLEHLPVAGLEVRVAMPGALEADADLLAAAVSNLLDNARRHGATRVTLSRLGPHDLRVADDGPGVPAERLAGLRGALEAQAYGEANGLGLGLMLADLVARAHGGTLVLPETRAGFVAELRLAAAEAAPGP